MFCDIFDCIFNINMLDFISCDKIVDFMQIISGLCGIFALIFAGKNFKLVKDDREKEKQKIIKKIEHIIDCCLIEIIKEEKILPYPYEVVFEITRRVSANEEYEKKYFFYLICVQDFSKRLGHIVLDLNKFKNSDKCKKYEDYEKYKDEKIKKECETIYNENKYLTTEILDAMIDAIHKYIHNCIIEFSEKINATY